MSLVENFRAAPPGRQILVVVGVLALLCALLFTAYFFFLRTPYRVLFSNLKTADAATIVAELDKRKLPYRLADGGATILTPENIVDSTRLSIMSTDLPIKGSVGFELFNKSDMGLTEFAQKINYQRALQGELARTLMSMDVIDTARVHLSLSEPTVFRDDRVPPKASVTLTPRVGKRISAGTVKGVQRLVASAVPDLDVANVAVLDEHGDVISNTIVAGTAPEAREREAIEALYVSKITALLNQAYPDKPLEVAVWANLDEAGASNGAAKSRLIAQTSPDGQILAPPPGTDAEARRDFRLRVVVSVDALLSDEDAARMRGLVSQAIQMDTQVGDAVTVAGTQTSATAASAASTPATSSVRRTPALPSLSSPLVMVVLVVLLVGLLFAAAMLLSRRSGGPRQLTAEQRGDFVEGLSSLLNREDANGSPRR